MGGNISRASTSDEVAEFVGNLGPGYLQYRDVIIDDGIDGAMIAEYVIKKKEQKLLDEYVTRDVHTTKFQTKLQEFAAELALGSPSDPPPPAIENLNFPKCT